MGVALEPHPQLGVLSGLIGVWEGEGRGSWDGRPEFHYRERLTFTHAGKPMLAYAQQTWALDDGRPLHGEQGYWRATGDGDVELVLAHGIGAVEIELGRWDGGRLELRSTAMQVTPSAKRVTALGRTFILEGGRLRYTLAMSVDGSAPVPHLSAELRRAPS